MPSRLGVAEPPKYSEALGVAIVVRIGPMGWHLKAILVLGVGSPVLLACQSSAEGEADARGGGPAADAGGADARVADAGEADARVGGPAVDASGADARVGGPAADAGGVDADTDGEALDGPPVQPADLGQLWPGPCRIEGWSRDDTEGPGTPERTSTEAFEYDDLGQLRTWTYTTRWSRDVTRYDEGGRVVAMVARDNEGRLERQTFFTFRFDAEGRVSERWIDYGGDGQVDEHERYLYDEAHRLTAIESERGRRVYSYDDQNRVVLIESADSFWAYQYHPRCGVASAASGYISLNEDDRFPDYTVSYTYNNQCLLTHELHQPQGESSSYDYFYDGYGNRMREEANINECCHLTIKYADYRCWLDR